MSVATNSPMPPKSPIWNHFYSNRTKFKTNQTHCNAWCKYCVDVYIRVQQAADQDALDRGERSTVRTREQLIDEGV